MCPVKGEGLERSKDAKRREINAQEGGVTKLLRDDCKDKEKLRIEDDCKDRLRIVADCNDRLKGFRKTVRIYCKDRERLRID